MKLKIFTTMIILAIIGSAFALRTKTTEELLKPELFAAHPKSRYYIDQNGAPRVLRDRSKLFTLKNTKELAGNYVQERCWFPFPFSQCGDEFKNCTDSPIGFSGCGILVPSGDCCPVAFIDGELNKYIELPRKPGGCESR